MRESFVFYRSYAEALRELPDEIRLKIMDAVLQYALDGEEPNLSGVEKAVFVLMRPQIDANNQRYENGKKGAESGARGGRPPKNKPQENPEETPKKPQENPTETPNVNVNVNVNANDNEIKEESVKEENHTSLAVQSQSLHTIRGEMFTKPTLEEVATYCAERGNDIDPQRFIDYYASKGWKVGNTPMKDWRAAVRTWERRDAAEADQKSRGSPPEDSQMDFILQQYNEAKERDDDRAKRLAFDS